jgi:hypothetical protein
MEHINIVLLNGGVCLVKNQITKNEPMNIDEYLIQRANA